MHGAELKLFITSSAFSEFISIKEQSRGVWNGSWILNIDQGYIIWCKISTVIAHILWYFIWIMRLLHTVIHRFHHLNYSAMSSLCSFGHHQSCSNYITLLMWSCSNHDVKDCPVNRLLYKCIYYSKGLQSQVYFLSILDWGYTCFGFEYINDFSGG